MELWPKQSKCPVCKKLFVKPPETVYKLTVNGRKKVYCSYTCFRVDQKKIEAGRKYRYRD